MVLGMIVPFCLFGSFKMGAPVVEREAGVEKSGPFCCATAETDPTSKNAIARWILTRLGTVNDMVDLLRTMFRSSVPRNIGRVKLLYTIAIYTEIHNKVSGETVLRKENQRVDT